MSLQQSTFKKSDINIPSPSSYYNQASTLRQSNVKQEEDLNEQYSKYQNMNLNQHNKRIQYPECKEKGLHDGERMNLICLDIGCQKNLIGCQECISQHHRTHHFQSIKTLLNSIEGDIIHMSGFDDREKLLATIELTEQEISQSVEQLQASLINKTNELKRSTMSVLKKMREEVHKYDQNKHTVEDLFQRIYSTNHTQETLAEYLTEILDLQKFQQEKENRNLTPVTKNAFDKINKYKSQTDEHLKNIFETFSRKLNNSCSLVKEFEQDRQSSLVLKENFFVFESSDNVTFNGESDILEGHSSQVRAATFSKNGRYLASGSSDNNIVIWDMNTQKIQAVLKGHKSYVMSISFSPDGNYLISGSYDKTIKVWNTKTLECISTLEGHTYLVNCVQFSHKGDKFLSGSNDTTIKLWSVENLKPTQILSGHHKWVYSAQFSPNDQQIASASGDRTIKIWNAQTFLCEATSQLEVLDGSDVICYSPNGLKIVSGGPNGILKIWSAVNLQCEANLVVGQTRIWHVAFSRVGNKIATATSDIQVKIWNSDTLKLESTLIGHSEPVMCVAFTPDGKKLVSGSQDNTLRLWKSQ